MNISPPIYHKGDLPFNTHQHCECGFPVRRVDDGADYVAAKWECPRCGSVVVCYEVVMIDRFSGLNEITQDSFLRDVEATQDDPDEHTDFWEDYEFGNLPGNSDEFGHS